MMKSDLLHHKYLIFGSIALTVFFIVMSLLFIATKSNFMVDEEYSYLLAAGKISNYYGITHDRKYPYGKLVDIAKYKELLKPDKAFIFKKIAYDSAFFDIHPPLYNWLLHLWIIMCGGIVHLWSGGVLNLILCIFIIALLYKFAFDFFQSCEDAIFCVLLFGLSPLVFHAINLARSHTLLAFIVLLSNCYLLKLIQQDRLSRICSILLFSLLVCLGLLSNYLFLAMCLAWMIFIVIYYWKRKVIILYFILALIIGSLLFFNMFSIFFANFNNYNSIVLHATALPEFRDLYQISPAMKIANIFFGKFGFLGDFLCSVFKFLSLPGLLLRYSLAGIVLLFFARCAWGLRRDKNSYFILFMFFLPLLFMLVSFLSKRCLPWVFTEKYFFYILPFFCIALVHYLRTRFLGSRRIILIFMCSMMFFFFRLQSHWVI